MANEDIKLRAKEKKVRLWRVAEAMNISQSQLSVMFRHELADDMKSDINRVIDSLSDKNV